MQIDKTPILPPKKSAFSLYLSLILVSAVVGAYIGLFFYNLSLDNTITDKKDAITHVEKQMSDISKDQDIIIRKILSSNTIRPSIDLRGLISEFRNAATRANVRLKGFSVKNDVISTSLIAIEWDPSLHPDPAATIIKMMREYDTGRPYFSLEPISSISGDSTKRTTGIEFHVKSK